jgi:hypothetical protein
MNLFEPPLLMPLRRAYLKAGHLPKIVRQAAKALLEARAPHGIP